MAKRTYNINEEMQDILNKFERYLVTLNKSKVTIVGYLRELRLFIDEENIKEAEQFDSFSKRWWLEYSSRKVEEGLNPSTIQKKINIFSSFYVFLQVEELATDNPCYKLPTINKNGMSDYKDKVMSEEQIRALLQATDTKEFQNSRMQYINQRDKLIIYLMCNVAPRIDEVSKIRLEDIDLQNNKLYIRGKGGKDKVTRYTNFNDKVKILIMGSIQRKPNRTYLFENYMGEQLNTETIRKVWYKACEICGLEGFTPHNIRHSVASSLVAKGVPIAKVSQVLGHSSGSKTAERFYIKPKEDMNDTLDVLDIF